MLLANVDCPAVLLQDGRTGHDIATVSEGRLKPDLPGIYEDWDSCREWASSLQPDRNRATFDRADLGAPSPAPRQIVALGLNYSNHVAEAGFVASTALPPLFTKFVSALVGADCTVTLPPGGHTGG